MSSSATDVGNVAGSAAFAVVLLLAAAARRPRSRRVPGRLDGPLPRRRHPSRRLLAAMLVVAALVPAAVLAGPVPLGVAGAATAAAAAWHRRTTERRLQRRIEEAMPDAVELLVLCVHAGRSPHQAIAELAARAPPAVRGAFESVELQVHRGRSLAAALAELPRQLGRPGRPVAAAVAGADRDGLPLGPVLDRLAGEARAARRRLGEAEARRLPVRLTFPLVTCTLPSFVLIAIAPAVLGALSTLRTTAP